MELVKTYEEGRPVYHIGRIAFAIKEWVEPCDDVADESNHEKYLHDVLRRSVGLLPSKEDLDAGIVRFLSTHNEELVLPGESCFKIMYEGVHHIKLGLSKLDDLYTYATEKGWAFFKPKYSLGYSFKDFLAAVDCGDVVMTIEMKDDLPVYDICRLSSVGDLPYVNFVGEEPIQLAADLSFGGYGLYRHTWCSVNTFSKVMQVMGWGLVLPFVVTPSDCYRVSPGTMPALNILEGTSKMEEFITHFLDDGFDISANLDAIQTYSDKIRKRLKLKKGERIDFLGVEATGGNSTSRNGRCRIQDGPFRSHHLHATMTYGGVMLSDLSGVPSEQYEYARIYETNTYKKPSVSYIYRVPKGSFARGTIINKVQEVPDHVKVALDWEEKIQAAIIMGVSRKEFLKKNRVNLKGASLNKALVRVAASLLGNFRPQGSLPRMLAFHTCITYGSGGGSLTLRSSVEDVYCILDRTKGSYISDVIRGAFVTPYLPKEEAVNV